MRLVTPQNSTIIFGFDSAWTDSPKAPGAICAIAFDDSGQVEFHEPRLVSFAAALTFIEALRKDFAVSLVALDQPTIVPNGSGSRPIDKVAAVGESASLIGTRIGERAADTRITKWTCKQKRLFTNVSGKRGATIPALITGTVALSQPLEGGTEGIIAVDGIAAGVIGELSGARSVVDFTAVLNFTLLTPGPHTVELFIRNPDGSLTSVGAPS